MENIVLVVHLILAICLIGTVLLQRSEGGGLGIGGGGGGGAMSGRQAATAVGKLTWGFAIAFLTTSIILTILAAQNSSTDSVLDRLSTGAPAAEEGEAPADGVALPPAGDLLPPTTGDAPALPPRVD